MPESILVSTPVFCSRFEDSLNCNQYLPIRYRRRRSFSSLFLPVRPISQVPRQRLQVDQLNSLQIAVAA